MNHNVIKTYIRTYAPSEDSDQPVHSHSLIWMFTGSISDTMMQSFFVLTTKTLIRLRGRAGWSVSSFGACVRRYGFSRCGSNHLSCLFVWFRLWRALPVYVNSITIIIKKKTRFVVCDHWNHSESLENVYEGHWWGIFDTNYKSSWSGQEHLIRQLFVILRVCLLLSRIINFRKYLQKCTKSYDE